MDFRDSLKWGLYDRVLAALAMLLGVAVAAAGLWFGTADWLLSGNLSDPPSGTGVAIAVGGVLFGLFVWQLGKAAARHRTMVSATERRVHRRLAGGDVEAGGDLEERIAQLEADVGEVRRVAARIDQALDERGASGGGSTSSQGGAAATGRSGSAATGGGSSAATTETTTDGTAGAADAGAAGTGAGAQAGGGGGGGGGAGATAGADANGMEFADDQSGAAADAGAAGGATSTPDGGTTGADAGQEDAFEWAEEDDDGEYYRNK